jgi:hypothetical protein
MIATSGIVNWVTWVPTWEIVSPMNSLAKSRLASTPPPRAACDPPGPVLDRAGPDGPVLDGSVLDGSVRDGSVRDGSVRDGSVRDGSVRDGAGPPGARCSPSAASSAPVAASSASGAVVSALSAAVSMLTGPGPVPTVVAPAAAGSAI